MGTSVTVSQMAGKLDRAGVELAKATKPMVVKAAAVIQKGAELTLNAAAPGGHLRNVKGSALKVTSRTTGAGAEATATVAASGKAYAILDNPTRGHWIGQGKSTKRVKRGFSGPSLPGKKSGHPIMVNGTWVTGPVLHPGTGGKRTFLTGSEAATPAALEVLRQGPQLAVAGVFR